MHVDSDVFERLRNTCYCSSLVIEAPENYHTEDLFYIYNVRVLYAFDFRNCGAVPVLVETTRIGPGSPPIRTVQEIQLRAYFHFSGMRCSFLIQDCIRA